MSWLPKNQQKRNQLFMALGATVVIIGGMYFGLIRPQYAKMDQIRKDTAEAGDTLKANKQVIDAANKSASELTDLASSLANEESDMATGDVYVWTIDTMRHFKLNYRVDVPEIGQPVVGDVDILAHFPYRQLKFTIRGTGYYHDIGKFIADFENKYPHMRVLNLDLQPIGAGTEKLGFSMDIVALVKSAS
jgi:Tfp pilus assembly protein PilO